jgi:hypothetical protein
VHRSEETHAHAKGSYALNIRSILAFLILLFLPGLSRASELKQETSQAWDHYIQAVNLRVKGTLAPGQTFLWIDQMAARRQRVRQGEIVVSPGEEDDPQSVPHGLIHDWIGAVFIPSVTIADVFAVVHDFDRYQDFYKPTVVEAKLLGRNGEDYAFSGVGLKKVFFWTIVLGGEFESHCSPLDRGRWYCISSSTAIQEIQDYRQADARKLQPDEGHGYIWRLYSIAKFEERDGGVYLELEMMALTRDFPTVPWLSKKVVEYLSRDAISTILQQTREAVQSKVAAQK